jgi:hypothetical protein
MYSGTSLTRTSKGPKIKFELRKIRVTEKYIQLQIFNLLCMYVIRIMLCILYRVILNDCSPSRRKN